MTTEESFDYDLEDLHHILENEWINTMFDLADEEERVSPHPHWRGDVHYIEGKLDALNSVLNKIERLIVLNNGTYYPGPRETVADDAT